MLWSTLLLTSDQQVRCQYKILYKSISYIVIGADFARKLCILLIIGAINRQNNYANYNASFKACRAADSSGKLYPSFEMRTLTSRLYTNGKMDQQRQPAIYADVEDRENPPQIQRRASCIYADVGHMNEDVA